MNQAKDAPFTLCEECGQPRLTPEQEALSLTLFFHNEQDKREFAALVLAETNMTAYSYAGGQIKKEG